MKYEITKVESRKIIEIQLFQQGLQERIWKYLLKVGSLIPPYKKKMKIKIVSYNCLRCSIKLKSRILIDIILKKI